MPRWSHSKKQVRDGLDAAVAAGLEVVDTSAHGHGWGYVRCPRCGQRFSVWSTPASPDNHAKQIRRFIQRHGHPDGVRSDDDEL